MSTPSGNSPELQVKSVERVRDLGEVFTPAATVRAMLDVLPTNIWRPHPGATFFEPACGDGNFLVAILDRKLDAITQARADGTLSAGDTLDAVRFHALMALSCIYAVDISTDNIVGGTPGHELGARDRMLAHLKRWYTRSVGGHLTERSPLTVCAQWVVERNVQVANTLVSNLDGTPSGRDQLPLIEYVWDPVGLSVTLFTTTLGAATAAAHAETSAAMTLFGPTEPTEVWSGKAMRINEACIDEPAAVVAGPLNARVS